MNRTCPVFFRNLIVVSATLAADANTSVAIFDFLTLLSTEMATLGIRSGVRASGYGAVPTVNAPMLLLPMIRRAL